MAKRRDQKRSKPRTPSPNAKRRSTPTASTGENATPPAPVVPAPEWEGQPCCLLCGKPDSAQCEHLMSTWGYGEEYAYWAVETDLGALRGVVEEIDEAVDASFTDKQ